MFRFSSLGDVAMTVPVLKNLLAQHPQLQITVVSTLFHTPLFAGIQRLHFFAADLKGKHKGFAGLFRLFRDLKKAQQIDAVADLHHVLRTQLLKIFFKAARIQWVSINKGRMEKRELTRPEGKILRPLKSTFERYADVFAELGFPIQLHAQIGIKEKPEMPAIIQQQKSSDKTLIGIAPFAQFSRKTYPPEKMKAAISMLCRHEHIKIYLLGGKADVPVLRQWVTEIQNIELAAGIMSFAGELAFIAHLDAVVSMDSANMHLASLFGVPVISVWGATHPYAGFYGWAQKETNAVQIELSCRPCSVFGNKPGPRTDLACMHGIAPLTLYEKVMSVIET